MRKTSVKRLTPSVASITNKSLLVTLLCVTSDMEISPKCLKQKSPNDLDIDSPGIFPFGNQRR